jgi:hypothetical protein
MDELMARFVTNIERDDCQRQFHAFRKVLETSDLANVEQQQIESSVKQSLTAMKDLLNYNLIEMERQPNCEN